MIQNLEQIEYRKGMLERSMKPENLPLKVWRGGKIPGNVRAAVIEEDLLNLGGVYGDWKAGNPVEYDHLRLILTPACRDARGAGRDDTVEITVFNRGIMLFTSDDEKVRRTHRVLCKLDQPGNGT
jgi:hypothetical protein